MTDTGPSSATPSRRAVSLSCRRVVGNALLLGQAAVQHAADDPALLAVQISRRLPFRSRVRAGRLLETLSPVLPGIAALGAMMSGDTARADALLDEAAGRGLSPLAGETAILMGREDLLGAAAPASTRARAAWARGDVDGAIEVLTEQGREGSRYAQRLRSERALLAPGSTVPPSRRVPSRPVDPPVGTGSSSSPTVLHLLTNSLPHTQSGYSLRSHRILTALRGIGIESTALTRTGYPVMVGLLLAAAEDLVDGIRYLRTLPDRLPRTQTDRVRAEVDAVLELVSGDRPDVLHATTNYLNALVAQSASRATGIPWVFEVRGLMEQTWAASHRGAIERRIAETSQRYRMIAAKEAELARSAHAVVTLSETMAQELTARGVDRDVITVIPNAVEADLLEDGMDTAAARAATGLDQRHGFGGEALLVGAVSALVDYEGFDILLRAVAHLLEDPSVPAPMTARLGVVLAGDGAARPGLAHLAEELGIADRVHLPGRVPRDQARRWVEALDIVVVPRRDVAVSRSVTPQKPVEALALGRPVVLSDLPALRESVTAPDGEVGASLVPAEDPAALAAEIAALLTEAGAGDPAAVSRRERGRRIARQRTWPTQVRRYRQVYAMAAERMDRGDRNGR